METVTVTNRIASLTPAKDSSEEYISDPDTGEILHRYYLINNRHSFHEYPHFRFICKADGTLWHDANLFMLDYIKEQPTFSNDSFTRYEQALREFIAFCEPFKKEKETGDEVKLKDNISEPNKGEDEKQTKLEVFIDYKKAERENDAPTHRFRKHLIETKIKTKKSMTAIDRLMPPVCAFYEWMIKNGHQFEVPLWKEKSGVNPYNGRPLVSKDVCQYINKKSDGQYVYDGGTLRPLSIQEERLIRKALKKIGNTEYRLIFLLALNSMARKQTILTLRLRDMLNALPGKVDEIPQTPEEGQKWLRRIAWPADMADCSIIVGKGHGADVKGDNKNFSIKIKGWLLQQLIVYMLSERAFDRRAKAFPLKTEFDQYLFLSDKGNPMYHAHNDPGYINKKKRRTKEPQTGNSLDQFINNELRPWLRLRGFDFDFHFHCLRATGAVRFLEERGRKAKRQGYSPVEWSADVEALRQLMGHSSTETTYLYLTYMANDDTLGTVVDNVGEWYIDMMSEYDNNTKVYTFGVE